MWRYFSIFLLSPVTIGAAAESARFGPILEEHGPTFAVNDLAVPVDRDLIYKAVFDASAHRQDVTEINAELMNVARFINMHARHGVPLGNMDLVVVIHGEAVKSALVHEAYRERYSVENPNLVLLTQLAEAGVRFYACGQ